MSAPRERSSAPSGYSGPWSDLPPAEPAIPREPLLKRRQAKREPLIRNWRGLAIIGFLLFLAPPLAGWLARLILAAMQHG